MGFFAAVFLSLSLLFLVGESHNNIRVQPANTLTGADSYILSWTDGNAEEANLPQTSAKENSAFAPEEYLYRVAVFHDRHFRANTDWLSRIDRAMDALARAFAKFDIRFQVISVSDFDMENVRRLGPRTFELLAERKGEADFGILFSGRLFPYISGKASEARRVLIVCARNKEEERSVLVHEMGHLFGLEHASDETESNYMHAGRAFSKRDHFIPENEKIIELTRDAGLLLEEGSAEVTRRRLNLLLKIYQTYKTDHFMPGEIGNTYYKLGEYSNALVYFSNELDYLDQLSPADKDSTKDWYQRCYRALGLTYGKLGRYKKAIEFYRKATQLRPDDPALYAELAWTYGELRQWQNAVEAYKAVIRLQPDFAAAHCNLGVAYAELGDFEKAIEGYKRAIELEPDFLEAQRNLAVAYSRLNRWQDAAEAFKQVIRIEPQDAEAYFSLGVAYGTLERYEAAVEAFSEAIRRDSTFVRAHRNLGVAFARLGRYQEAVRAYKAAIRIDPGDGEAHYNLGLTYLVLTDKRSALEVHHRLEALDDSLASELMNLIREAESARR
jgi:tetratricopeptide (TPR) repeat protein